MSWDTEVLLWWISMSTIGLMNILLWVLLVKKQSLTSWIFSGGLYIIGCASRCFTPRSDIDRIVMFDNFFSSIFVGRTIATVAELGFIAQWAIVLHLVGEAVSDKKILFVSKIIFPMIFIAEIFSWYASLTTNAIGSIFEESLWGVAFLFISFATLAFNKHLIPRIKPWAYVFTLGLIIYVIYMFAVDVPFYFSKWEAGIVYDKTHDSLETGILNMMGQWRVSRQTKDWQYEFIWQGLYFSFGAWTSLLLNLIPLNLKNLIKSK
jgi:hypothetical protein